MTFVNVIKVLCCIFAKLIYPYAFYEKLIIMCLFFHISVPLCKAVHDIAYNLEINKVICITK